MPGIIQQDVEDYLSSILPPRDEVLAEMEKTANARDIPIVGPSVGRLLYQLGLMVQAYETKHYANLTAYDPAAAPGQP